ncbi:MAG: low molecular weight phosphotyrosine protein phosphatase [Geminicoccaceae bacterium]|nr:MAG: low molecular weight phosphotyrosine protein phosphatase [Geminicoccaceae bacterium]
MVRVCFVCTGNICRSPTAEAVFRLRAAAAGLAVDVDSCGISDEERGNPPDPRAIAEAARRGVILPKRRARQIRARDFDVPGLLVGMTAAHVRALQLRRAADAAASVHLLLDFAPGLEGRDVLDPWFEIGRSDFADAFELIEHGVDGLIRHLQSPP